MDLKLGSATAELEAPGLVTPPLWAAPLFAKWTQPTHPTSRLSQTQWLKAALDGLTVLVAEPAHRCWVLLPDDPQEAVSATCGTCGTDTAGLVVPSSHGLLFHWSHE